MLDDLACADAAVVSCLDASVWALAETDLTAAVDAVHALEQRVAAVKLALVREVDGRGLPVKQGATSTAVCLRERLRVSIQAGHRLVALAAALDSGPPVIRDALAAATVTLEQAAVIGTAVEALPSEAGPQTVAEAASLLVTWAGQLEPTALRTAGARILLHVAPDLAEEADRRTVERDAERAQQQRHLTWSIRSDGQLHLKGVLDAEAGAALTAALSPLAGPSEVDDTRSPGQRRHDALTEVCRLALRTGELPESGGDAAQVVITTNYDTLTRQLGTGTLDTGLRLTPEDVRRFACDAGILPAVLGGTSQTLNLGRLRRLVTGPLRRALNLRDVGCAFPGCDRPAQTDYPNSSHPPGSTPSRFPAVITTTDAADQPDRGDARQRLVDQADQQRGSTAEAFDPDVVVDAHRDPTVPTVQPVTSRTGQPEHLPVAPSRWLPSGSLHRPPGLQLDVHDPFPHGIRVRQPRPVGDRKTRPAGERMM